VKEDNSSSIVCTHRKSFVGVFLNCVLNVTFYDQNQDLLWSTSVDFLHHNSDTSFAFSLVLPLARILSVNHHPVHLCSEYYLTRTSFPKLQLKQLLRAQNLQIINSDKLTVVTKDKVYYYGINYERKKTNIL